MPGSPQTPPPEACVGTPYTDEQWAMICRLERLIDYFVRPGPLSSQTLGRSGEKFSQLFAAAQELPIGELDLLELV